MLYHVFFFGQTVNALLVFPYWSVAWVGQQILSTMITIIFCLWMIYKTLWGTLHKIVNKLSRAGKYCNLLVKSKMCSSMMKIMNCEVFPNMNYPTWQLFLWCLVDLVNWKIKLGRMDKNLWPKKKKEWIKMNFQFCDRILCNIPLISVTKSVSRCKKKVRKPPTRVDFFCIAMFSFLSLMRTN